MSLLKREITKKEMAKYAGVFINDVDNALDGLVAKGLIKYQKLKNGNYRYSICSPDKRIDHRTV